MVFDFLLKNESCQNYVLTIPLCRKGKRTITHINGKGGDCWNIANYVAAIVKADGCHCQRRWLQWWVVGGSQQPLSNVKVWQPPLLTKEQEELSLKPIIRHQECSIK